VGPSLSLANSPLTSCTFRTRESDRLAALSGIAQQVHERIGGRYVAGIFSTGLVEGLLWRVIDYIPKNPQFPRQLSSISRRRPRVPNAPSWSWASLELHEAEIKFLYQSAKSTPQISVMAESIQMEAEEKQLNPYGQVLGGRLTMKGTMLAARAQYYNLGSEDYYYGLNLLDDESGEVIGRADFDCKTWPAEKFWCVPIMTVPDLGHIFGLILAPRYEGTYVRIGRFNTERADLLNSLKSEAIIII
jgi:hypothetical protein